MAADYLYCRQGKDGKVRKISLYDDPTTFHGLTVPIRKSGRTLFACYGAINDQRASPINCKVNGETKRILVSYIVDGSVSVGSLGTTPASINTVGTYEFTAPGGCDVVKISGQTYYGGPNDATGYGYFGKVSAPSWEPTTSTSGVWTKGNGINTVYVSVTPGKTYTLYGRWVKNVTISYGVGINELIAQFSWD